MKDEGGRMKDGFFFLPSAFCLLPSAFCPPPYFTEMYPWSATIC